MSTLTASVDEGVALVTFTRPPQNCMDVASLEHLIEVLDDLAGRSDEVKVVMLTGGVDGYFVAHADFDDLDRWRRGEGTTAELTAWQRATERIEALPQPTIAAIDGQAWGGGCELALACTMRVGSSRSHLALPEVSVGVIPGAGGTQRLPRLVAPAVAAEIILSGKIVKADDAHRIGLLNAVLPTEGFVPAALRWCGRFTRHPAGAVQGAKRAIVNGAHMSFDEGIRLEREVFDMLNASAEAQARRLFPRPA